MISLEVTNSETVPCPLRRTDCCKRVWYIQNRLVKLPKGTRPFEAYENMCPSCMQFNRNYRRLKRSDCCSIKWMIKAKTFALNPGHYPFGHLQSVCTSCRLWENLTFLQQEK